MKSFFCGKRKKINPIKFNATLAMNVCLALVNAYRKGEEGEINYEGINTAQTWALVTLGLEE